ncbi:MAG: YggS family pyridoxal phosphate-dependent enzyme [Euryarchaeota archaeon]|nr:YggS family pyridoxal phosphate-dependent enzyme [Euryarchaeota archaeon]
MNDIVQIKKNLLNINNKVSEAAKASGRSKKDITLVAVTKTFPEIAWQMSLKSGLLVIGENRIKETEEKYKTSINNDKIELHLIGHLQSNKVRKAIKLFNTIQTVDSLKLANKINTVAKENNKTQNIYIQVNSGKDSKKTGFDLEGVYENIQKISMLKNIKIKGIMTIPPNLLPENKLRDIYKVTKNIKDEVYKNIISSCTDLSMGMSNDYQIAIQEGATHIRLGTAIFGSRTR